MTLGDELEHLARLHQQGLLSESEFALAKARVIGGTPRPAAPQSPLQQLNTLQRSRSDRWLGGVCAGIGQATAVAPWVWRLLFAALVLCAGSGALIYLLLWILVPLEPATTGGATAYRTSEPAH